MRTVSKLMDLRGRVAVVTGGGGHIGGAMADAFAEQGADLVILDLEQGACDEAARRLERSWGVTVLPLAADLGRESEIRSVPERVLERFGRLDILVNCAALVSSQGLPGWTVPFLEQSAETWRMALEVNLTAPFILSQLCAPALKASGHGSIINIGSLYGVAGPDMRLYEGLAMGNAAAYAASKGGLLQLTRWLATVLAPDIRVNALTPGGLWRGQPEEFHERYRARTPLQRMGSEEDFKGAAAYLASDLSAYMTGQNLVLDGGFTVW
jgi:NAD(P)-dependent dehydrogenase (short-subunit alcohol dehydrogenase family)